MHGRDELKIFFDFFPSSTITSSTGASRTRSRTWCPSGTATGSSRTAIELRIIEADADLYLAEIDGKVVVKIGSRFDCEHLIPEGFQVSAHGDGYAVWEKI